MCRGSSWYLELCLLFSISSAFSSPFSGFFVIQDMLGKGSVNSKGSYSPCSATNIDTTNKKVVVAG